MKIICAAHPGGPDVLRVVEAPTPTPAPGQLLVRVASASVNFSDIMRRRGDVYPIPTRWPYVPGSEVAGVVEAVGDGVDASRVGTNVFALAGEDGSGGYAQFALCSAASAVPIPDGLSSDTAASLVVAGVTPMLMLTQPSSVDATTTVLVSAGAGGVGGFAIQIARALGARVLAGASTEERRARALALGADVAVDTSSPTWSAAVLAATDGRGVDVALDAGGASTFGETLASLAPFGTAVVYGYAGGEQLRFSSTLVERFFYSPAPNQTIRAFNLAGFAFG
jgi:NADPH:quinone reductase-like Zn-dependent oxidoreductase